MARLSLLFSALLLFPLASTIPAPSNQSVAENAHTVALALQGSQLTPRQRADAPDHSVLLRIMPLGASITAGVGESSGNGYRKPLRDKLRWENWDVNYIGSQHTGDASFHNQAHEGHPGYVVRRVHEIIGMSIGRKPNLILINAGTNDANPGNNQDVGGTGDRMDAMITDLFAMSEGTTIILSTLIPNGKFDANVELVNEQYRALVRRRKAAGDRIELAEMHDGFITVYDVRNDPNLTHPDAEGFRKMAAVWYEAITRVADRIVPPIDTGISDTVGDNICDKKPGGRGPVVTQRGSGSSDGTYAHSSEGRGRVYQLLTELFTPDGGPPTNQLHLAQLVNAGGAARGGEIDEIVVIHDRDFLDETHLELSQYGYYQAYGAGVWADTRNEFDPGLECLARGVRFGDLNNDGLDDFICINPTGNMYVSINQGGNPPKFKPTANGGLIRTGEPWCEQSGVRLGDIDGDGRLDYCCIDGQGDIYCWRNGGQGDAPTPEFDGYWQPMVGGTPTFNAKGEPGIQGVRLVDINGDFRADWVYVYEDGSTRIFINQRGEGTDGGRLKPHWVEASVAHRGFPGEKPFVLFGRVYGSNRADYITITEEPDLLGLVWNVNVWENKGSGGTLLKGDGVFYCDMHGQGYDDYLAVEKDGSVTLYSNIQDPPFWGQDGTIFQLQGNYGLENVHFGDWDGDGYCDVIVVQQPGARRRPTSHRWWRNKHDLTFSQGSGQPDLSWCEEIHGVGQFDQHIHFADVDGDGRVDILCMAPDGKTYGALNKAGGLQQLGQVKVSVGFDRASHRFADVNGDGLADFLWIDKFNGDTRVWYNEGLVSDREANLNSSIKWRPAGKAYGPMDRGYNMHFPTLGTVGRADFHLVHPQTAEAETWFNECPNGGGAIEDGEPADPNLPTPPADGGGDGDGEFEEIVLPAPSADDLPDGYNLIEQDLRPAAAGDVFRFTVDEDRIVEIALTGSAVDFPNIDCGVHFVGGNDGDTLSCVAESTAWLFYSIDEMAEEAASLERRDKASQGQGRHGVSFHEEWTPRGDCATVHCMLMTHAPENTWLPLGNGTSSAGVFHEHHVARVGNMVGHRGYPGGFGDSADFSFSSPADRLAARDRKYRLGWNGFYVGGWFVGSRILDSGVRRWYTYRPDPANGKFLSAEVASFAESAVAMTDFHEICIKLGYKNSTEIPTIGWIDYNFDALDETPAEYVADRLNQCEKDFQESEEEEEDPNVALVCYHNLTRDDPSLALNEDDYDDLKASGPLPWQQDEKLKNVLKKRRFSFGDWFTGLLTKRTATSGHSEDYDVHDISGNTGRTITFLAPTYPNGDNGQSLIDTKDNGDITNYGLMDEDDCANGDLTDNANVDDPTAPHYYQMITEHIQPERQNLRNALEYIQNPEMDLADGNGVQRSSRRAISFDEQLMWTSVPYYNWLAYPLPQGFNTNLLNTPGSFYSDLADSEGSSTNPEVLVNLEKHLNGYKASIMNTFKNPTSDARFNPLANNPSKSNTETCLSWLRQGLAVFNYLNTDHVLDLQALFYTRLQAACLKYDVRYNLANPLSPQSDMTGLMTEFLVNHSVRMTNVHRAYMVRRLKQLRDAWNQYLTGAHSPLEVWIAMESLRKIAQVEAQIPGTIRFHANSYIFRQPGGEDSD